MSLTQGRNFAFLGFARESTEPQSGSVNPVGSLSHLEQTYPPMEFRLSLQPYRTFADHDEERESYRSIEQHYGLTVKFRSRPGSLEFSSGAKRPALSEVGQRAGVETRAFYSSNKASLDYFGKFQGNGSVHRPFARSEHPVNDHYPWSNAERIYFSNKSIPSPLKKSANQIQALTSQFGKPGFEESFVTSEEAARHFPSFFNQSNRGLEASHQTNGHAEKPSNQDERFELVRSREFPITTTSSVIIESKEAPYTFRASPFANGTQTSNPPQVDLRRKKDDVSSQLIDKFSEAQLATQIWQESQLLKTTEPKPSDASPVMVFEIEIEGIGKYRGELADGIMHGKGQLSGTDDFLLYQGWFVENEFDGMGVLYTRDPEALGAREEPWKNLTLIEPCVSKYEGHFKHNLPNGTGLKKFGDSAEFFGEFIGGKAQGFGIWTQGKERIAGIWENDEMKTRF